MVSCVPSLGPVEVNFAFFVNNTYLDLTSSKLSTPNTFPPSISPEVETLNPFTEKKILCLIPLYSFSQLTPSSVPLLPTPLSFGNPCHLMFVMSFACPHSNTFSNYRHSAVVVFYLMSVLMYEVNGSFV